MIIIRFQILKIPANIKIRVKSDWTGSLKNPSNSTVFFNSNLFLGVKLKNLIRIIPKPIDVSL